MRSDNNSNDIRYYFVSFVALVSGASTSYSFIMAVPSGYALWPSIAYDIVSLLAGGVAGFIGYCCATGTYDLAEMAYSLGRNCWESVKGIASSFWSWITGNNETSTQSSKAKSIQQPWERGKTTTWIQVNFRELAPTTIKKRGKIHMQSKAASKIPPLLPCTFPQLEEEYPDVYQALTSLLDSGEYSHSKHFKQIHELLRRLKFKTVDKPQKLSSYESWLVDDAYYYQALRPNDRNDGDDDSNQFKLFKQAVSNAISSLFAQQHQEEDKDDDKSNDSSMSPKRR